MDKLAKIFYNDSNLTYHYNNSVKVPVLEMVDDVLSVSKCSSKSITSHATVNSFIDINKLKLSSTKCSKIHIGNKCDHCPKLFVDEQPMKESHAEKYLGDVISSDGTIDKTINDRKLKAYSYLSEIKALITDLPFSKRRLQIGIMLRDAIFVNGILFNSEAWHNIAKNTYKNLKQLIIHNHSKVSHISYNTFKIQDYMGTHT